MNPRLQRACALSALALLPLASACAQSVEGQTYAPGAFERLELAGSANVKLVQGEHDQVFIVGGPEQQKTVELDYNAERLRIRSTGGWKFWSNNRLQIEVMMRKISALVLSGASDLHAAGPVKSEKLAISISGSGLARLDDLNVQQLLFAVSGAGDGQLRGQAGELRMQISGKGKLLAENLHVARANLSISGIGGANVWVSDELRVHVSGIGSVDYWGLPSLTRTMVGIATFNSRGDKPWPPSSASSASSASSPSN